MLKIYVAGKNLERAKKIMNILKECGYIVIFDWTKGLESGIKNEENPKQKAIDERNPGPTRQGLVGPNSYKKSNLKFLFQKFLYLENN